MRRAQVTGRDMQGRVCEHTMWDGMRMWRGLEG